MKKILFVLITLSICLSSCKQINKNIEERKRAIYVADSIAQSEERIRKYREKYEKKQAGRAKEIEEEKAKNSIRIKNKRINVNSVGGVDVKLHIENISDKTIKYITFECYFTNRVGDFVKCDIKGAEKCIIQYVGPLNTNQWEEKTWENVFYNINTDGLSIHKCSIEYMDGTIINANGSAMIYIEGILK